MKQTQTYRLYQILKSGEPVKIEVLASTLNIKTQSVPVYIHELKRVFKANIRSVREGKRVGSYQLLNADKIKVNEFPKNSYGPVAKAKPKTLIASIAEELEAVNTGGVTEKEFADIKSSLGLDGSFGGPRGGDY
jgi:hypothetical protein